MKLSEMNSEVSKAQEHAQKFQDLLTMERRKKKALEVSGSWSLTINMKVHVKVHVVQSTTVHQHVLCTNVFIWKFSLSQD